MSEEIKSKIRLVSLSEVPKLKSKRKRGRNKSYRTQERNFVKKNWEHMSDAELGAALNRSISSVKAFRQKNGLVKKNRLWSQEEIQIAKKHYTTMSNDELLKLLPGRNIRSLYALAHRFGLKKSDEFIAQQLKDAGKKLAQSGLGNRFKKGNAPMNKGLKQEDYMSPEAIEKCKRTRFKKGNVPANAKFNGAISLRKDSKGISYLWIRIGLGKWQEYHRYMYEKHIGPIPKNHIVIMKDGNSLNCEPSNLEAITRQEHVQRNRNWEKSLRTMDERRVGPKYYTDNTIAAWLSYGDKELRKHILAFEPELIRAARAHYKLKRAIKNEDSNDE